MNDSDNINQERALDRPRNQTPWTQINQSDYYAQTEEKGFRDYWRIILRRRWTIITFLLVLLTTVTIASFLMRPVYKAKTTVQIDKENPHVLYFKDVYSVERPEQDYYQTQYKILESRNLAKRVIKALNLENNPEFTGDNRQSILQYIKEGLGLAKQKEPEDGVSSELIDNFIRNTVITPVKGSRLVTVGFMNYDPELSAKTANMIAKTFIDLSVENKFEASQQARDWLEKQLEILQARVEASEEKLNKYAGENGIIGMDERQNIVTQRLTELSTTLTQATAEKINKESLFRESQSEEKESNPLVLSSPLVQKLKNDYSALEAEYYQSLKLYKPEYPKMVRLQEQMNKLRDTIDRETRRIISGIRSDYQAALKRENSAKDALEKQKDEALALNNRAIQYNILKREADTNKELYNGLLQRLKETGVSAAMTMSNIQILDRAEVPRVPYKPKKAFNILIAFIVGLFGGTGIAFFMEYLDDTVKTHEDIEKNVRLPFLGLVPYFTKDAAKMQQKIPFSKQLMPLPVSKSLISEAYRNIRTSILFASSGGPPKVILMTSTRIGEGKTTTAYNTALTLVQAGGKVLLIDSDMRRPKLHEILNLKNSEGLSDYLSGNHGIDAVQVKSSVQNLYAITSGTRPPNPSELVGSNKMRELINGLQPIYDHIIIDSPPMLGISDAVILSTMADGVILVIKAGETTKEAVNRARKVLFDVDAKILGTILNCVDLQAPDYNYYYNYYYGYHYSNYSEKDLKKR